MPPARSPDALFSDVDADFLEQAATATPRADPPGNDAEATSSEYESGNSCSEWLELVIHSFPQDGPDVCMDRMKR